MKLRFEDITATPQRYDVEDSAWFPSEEDHTVSAVAHIIVNRRDSQYITLRGRLNGTYTTQCGRCRVDVKNELHSDFDYLITRAEDPSVVAPDIECENQDVNTLYVEESEIDIDEILREQAYLEIPLRTLCKENCKGMCVGCGNDLNITQCSCVEDNMNSPFAVLGKLKKN